MCSKTAYGSTPTESFFISLKAPLGSEVVLDPSKLTATLSPGISVKHLVQYTYLMERKREKSKYYIILQSTYMYWQHIGQFSLKNWI